MRRDDPAAEVRDELEAHFEGTVELLMARGWTEAAARAEVARRFGDERRYRSELERGARRRSLRRRMGESWQTLLCAGRAALRSVHRSPGLSAAIVLTLALGLGANAAIFRVVDRLLLSPPPHIERPEEVRQLHRTVMRKGESLTVTRFTYADVNAMRTVTPDVRVAAVMSYMPETLGRGPSAVRLRVARVDAEYFPLLGVRPVHGRALLADDHARGAAVIVLSHRTWQSHFGGDPGVIGRTVRAAEGEYEVVGVMPPGFHGSHAPAADLWIPLETEATDWFGEGWRTSADAPAFSVLARLPESMPRAAWEARVTDALRATGSGGGPGMELLSVGSSSLVPADAPNPSSTIPVSRWVAGVSLLVLLVACANTANLFLADAERHRRQTAVRVALGASAGALRAELMTRALCLALLGAAGAVLFAFWGGNLLDGLFTGDIEPATRPDTTRLLVFTGALGVAAALLAGLLPALRLPRVQLSETLGGGGRVVDRTGVARRTLAAVQVALCVVLVAGAGLFIASFRNALNVDLGFDHERLMMLRLERDDGVDIPHAQLLADARIRLLAVPSVESVTGTVAVPFAMLYGLSASTPDGQRITDLTVNAVGTDFFRTMGVPIERGRALDARDMGAGAEPVVVVSRRTALRLWEGVDPLAQCLHVGQDGPCARVIGVAGDHAGVSMVQDHFAPTHTMQAWVATGFPGAQGWSALLVRTALPPARVIADVRRAAAGAGVRYVEAEPMDALVARVMRSWQLGATVFSLFGVIALLVAGVGLYGVLSFEVAQRRRELGIRAALGAGRLRVLLPVARFALPVVLAGIASGTAVATLASGRLAGLLFEVGPRDPVILAAAAAAAIAMSAAALLVPGWRAVTVDPRETLSDGG